MKKLVLVSFLCCILSNLIYAVEKRNREEYKQYWEKYMQENEGCETKVFYSKTCSKNGYFSSYWYKEWFKQWGDYEWGSSGPGDKEYASDIVYTIIHMIKINDMNGLKAMLETLGYCDIKYFNAAIAPGTAYDEAAISSGNAEALQFIFENGINQIDKDTSYEYYDSVNDKYTKTTPLQLANQKLTEAKIANDTLSIKNYEKIIKLLEEYGIE